VNKSRYAALSSKATVVTEVQIKAALANTVKRDPNNKSAFLSWRHSEGQGRGSNFIAIKQEFPDCVSWLPTSHEPYILLRKKCISSASFCLGAAIAHMHSFRFPMVWLLIFGHRVNCCIILWTRAFNSTEAQFNQEVHLSFCYSPNNLHLSSITRRRSSCHFVLGPKHISWPIPETVGYFGSALAMKKHIWPFYKIWPFFKFVSTKWNFHEIFLSFCIFWTDVMTLRGHI